MKLLAVGKLKKNKDEIKAVVEEMGGKITPTANKADLCLSNASTYLAPLTSVPRPIYRQKPLMFTAALSWAVIQDYHLLSLNGFVSP